MNTEVNSPSGTTALRMAILGTIVGGMLVMVLTSGAWPRLLNGLGTTTSNPIALGSLEIHQKWTGRNLGSSLAPFFLVAILYARALAIARCALRRNDLPGVSSASGSLQLWSTSFFGIGVLWTAIGMRDALMYSLGDFAMQGPGGVSAYELMSRLVEGGVLTALTTTIVGGAGAYLMNIMTHLTINTPAQRLLYTQELKERQQLLRLLSEIREASQGDVDNDHLHRCLRGRT